MDYIESMLTGKISMEQFAVLLQNDADLQNEIRGLIPDSAKNDPEHELWSHYSYDSLREAGFDCYEHMVAIYRYDTARTPTAAPFSQLSFGINLNIFSVLRHFYCYLHPETVCTFYYNDAFDLFLDAVGDTFDGPEVEPFTERLINDFLLISPKTKRKKTVKEAVKKAFHAEDGIRPYWIQGAEWPMGIDSPMKFIKSEKNKKVSASVCYYFQDVTTEEIRMIEQFY